MDEWTDLGGGAFVRPDPDYRVNTGLVIGAARALVIDTGSGPRQGRRILAAVREKTTLPLTVVNTHAHFDHYFGNAVFAADGVTEFRAHRRAAAAMAVGEKQRPEAAATEPEMAAGSGPASAIFVPTQLVDGGRVVFDLGGMSVELFHLGRGHTDGDLLVRPLLDDVPSVVFTGDLVEEGADPSFEDAYPDDWVRALQEIVASAGPDTVFVPGHGSPVDAEFVRAAAETMQAAVRIGRQALRESANNSRAANPLLPYGPEQSCQLLTRLR